MGEAKPMRIAIVGAGAAGLVTAREALRAGLEPVVFEVQDRVGGTWIHRPAPESDPLGLAPETRVASSMYDGLRTNLPVDLMAFRDTAFEHERRFADHRTVLRYLEAFADRYELLPHIRFQTRVVRVAPSDGARPNDDGSPEGFFVATRGATAEREDRFDAIAIANGHYTSPYVPPLEGEACFTAPRSHSHNYRRPEPFANKRVALLGAKASGTDIALELADAGAEVHLCARDHNALAAATTLPPRLTLEPAIARLVGPRTLRLTDGRDLAVDHLMYCTGYRYDLSFFDEEMLEDGKVLIAPLYRDLIAPQWPRLGFIGLPFTVIPFPFFEAQARFFIASLTGRLELPPAELMAREAELERAELERAGVARRHFLRYGERQFAYLDALRAALGEPPLPAAFRTLYRATTAARQRDPVGYRDDPTWFPPHLAPQP